MPSSKKKTTLASCLTAALALATAQASHGATDEEAFDESIGTESSYQAVESTEGSSAAYEETPTDAEVENSQAIDSSSTATAGGMPAAEGEKGEESTEESSVNWESYSDFAPVSSVAEEITGGVRVEDIVEPPTEYR